MFKLIVHWLCLIAVVPSLIYAITTGDWIWFIAWFVIFDGGSMTINAGKLLLYLFAKR